MDRAPLRRDAPPDEEVARDVARHWSTTDRAGRPVVATRPVQRAAVDLLRRAQRLATNFDEDDLARGDGGWVVDDRASVLAREPVGGPPDDGGAFDRAAAALRDYAMADPRLVRACWYAGTPLEGRTMVLEGRFGPLRFLMPVRVGTVVEQQLTLLGDVATVAGWDYATLDGHLERGRMDWSVWKWHTDGSVEFRIHARSRRAEVLHPVVALGMAVFGRAMQVLFTRQARERLRGTAADPGAGGPALPTTARTGRVTGPLADLLG